MSLLKVNEVQNYNGSSLTLTASTVSTSAQLNTGGNISVTGSLNVSDDSTTRSNLGLGSIATQASDNVTITGGNISNATLASSVTFPTNHLIGFGYGEETSNTGEIRSTSGGFQSSGIKGIIFGTEINVGSVLNGQKLIFTLMGGQAAFNSTENGVSPYYNTSCGIAYNTDNTSPTTASTRVILWSSNFIELGTGSSSVSPCGSHVIINSSGSTQTIKIKFWLGANNNFSNANMAAKWDGSITYNPIRYQYYILSA